MELNETESVYKVSYQIIDPADCDFFVQKVKVIDPRYKNFSFLVDNAKYLSLQSSITSIGVIATSMVTASILMGIIIVTLLVINNLQQRVFEIGMLLSLGESKFKIILQVIIETLVPIILAVTCSISISGMVTGQIASLIGGENLVVKVDSLAVLLVYLCGMGLTIIASTVTVYKITKYNPKDILMAAG